MTYTPPPHGAAWATTTAELSEVARFARASESAWPRSMYYPDGAYVGNVEWNESGPWCDVVGPVEPRGGPAGLVLIGGRIAAEWGDTTRADMTFSVAKSYLSVLTGLALDDRLIRDLDAPVGATVTSEHFTGPRNGAVTWRHLLHQNSEWSGELWGKSDQVDHFRQVGVGADNSRKGRKRDLGAPGTHYEYNDVRVNVLAYALLRLFRRPLPDVFAERIAGPIGASTDWRWEGYSTSWTEVDGRRVQSVTGGAHWGGGLFIGARDQARLGLLIARGGVWGDRRLLSKAVIDEMMTPSATNPDYGAMWWLDRGPGATPDAAVRAVMAMGAGSNIIWVDRDRDVVAVARWIDKTATDGFVTRLRAALRV